MKTADPDPVRRKTVTLGSHVHTKYEIHRVFNLTFFQLDNFYILNFKRTELKVKYNAFITSSIYAMSMIMSQITFNIELTVPSTYYVK